MIEILSLCAFVFQVVGAYLAYRIYQFNRLSWGWIALIFAFIFQAARRLFQFYADATNVTTNIILDRSIMLAISLLMVIGLFSMLKNFENLDVIEKNVKNKIKRNNGRK